MKKGVIIELRNQYTYVLTQNGRVKKIKREYDHEIGQEIQISFMHSKKTIPVILMTCAILITFVLYSFQNTPDVQALSYVSLSVNPGLVLKVNDQNHIESVSYTNQEGQQVIKDIDFINKTMDESIILFIDYCFENNYFQENNKIDINVISDDKNRIKSIEQQVQTLIENYLDEHQVTITIQMDQVTSSQQKDAKTYGIPDSKMKLIDLVCYYYPQFDKESLAKESVDDLIDYLEDAGYDEHMLDRLEDEIEDEEEINKHHNSSQVKITKDMAKEIALKQINGIVDDIDYEDDENIYEVEIKSKNKEYKVMIDAASGEVITIEEDR